MLALFLLLSPLLSLSDCLFLTQTITLQESYSAPARDAHDVTSPMHTLTQVCIKWTKGPIREPTSQNDSYSGLHVPAGS
jgi:hypothetical protein